MALPATDGPRDRYLRGHSCRHCQRIVLPGEEEQLLVDYSKPWGTPMDELSFRDETLWRLGVSFEDMRAADLDGCTFAGDLLQNSNRELPGPLSPAAVQLYSSQVGAEGPAQLYWLVALAHTDHASAEGLVPAQNRQKYASASTDVWFSTIPIAADEGGQARLREFSQWKREPIAADPLSQETVSSVRQWIQDCSSSRTGSHTICALSEPPYLPSRLIEVQRQGSSLHLRLVRGEDLGPDAKYTALSYCWGSDPELLLASALKKDKLRSYGTEIPWATLPKTLQDAAVTTHRLGMQFLWADSLCIIQDDDNDKAREIGGMAQVYCCATLTIMASRAGRAADGFLHPRSLPPGTSTLTFQGLDGTEELRFLTFGLASAFTDGEKSSLDERGWVLQEHLLSRRTLEIGTWMTVWSCRRDRDVSGHRDGWSTDRHRRALGYPFRYKTEWSAEDRKASSTPGLPPTGPVETSPLGDSHILDAVMFSSANPGHQHPRPAVQAVLNIWQDIVKTYTTRLLSVPTDRILAISGIAARFASSIPGGGRYAAGLWEKSLPISLLWYVPGPLGPRPPSYQGPSWSWTAMGGYIHFDTFDVSSASEVLSVECAPLEPEAPFGALKSGTLRIEGPAIDVEGRDTRLPYRHDWRYLGADSVSVDLHAYLDDRWDAPEIDLDWTPVTLLVVASRWQSRLNSECRKGLILRQEENGSWHRVGFFNFKFDPDKPHPSIITTDWPKRKFIIT